MLARGALWLETALALALARTIVLLCPFPAMRRLFSPPAERQDAVVSDHHLRRALGVARRITRVSARLPWRSTCLVQATAAALLLARRGIPGGIIRFGVRRQHGRLEAHAWLMLGEAVLLGGVEAPNFTALADLRCPAP